LTVVARAIRLRPVSTPFRRRRKTPAQRRDEAARKRAQKALKGYYPSTEPTPPDGVTIRDPREALFSLLVDFRLGIGWSVTEIATRADALAEKILSEEAPSRGEPGGNHLRFPALPDSHDPLG
jgi:hypothetical protein